VIVIAPIRNPGASGANVTGTVQYAGPARLAHGLGAGMLQSAFPVGEQTLLGVIVKSRFAAPCVTTCTGFVPSVVPSGM
jgi:hypothetical protein